MPFQRLPDHVRKTHDVSDAWHHRHEERIDALESRQSKNDGQHHLIRDLFKQQIKTPIGDLPLPLALIAAGFCAVKYPDLFTRWFGP